MKKNAKKIGVLLLIGIVAVGSYFVSGTYAKYTSSVAGSSTATVAKWKWTFGSDVIDTAEKASQGYTFDLFDTIKEADTTSTETDVAASKIAPGTGGEFEISLKNDSEVNAEYAIALTETNNNGVPIEYSTDGTTWGTAASLNVAATAIAMNETKTLTVKWRWAFTGDASANFTSTQTDTTDTALGFAANQTAPTVQVTATVTLTQVD